MQQAPSRLSRGSAVTSACHVTWLWFRGEGGDGKAGREGGGGGQCRGSSLLLRDDPQNLALRTARVTASPAPRGQEHGQDLQAVPQCPVVSTSVPPWWSAGRQAAAVGPRRCPSRSGHLSRGSWEASQLRPWAGLQQQPDCFHGGSGLIMSIPRGLLTAWTFTRLSRHLPCAAPRWSSMWTQGRGPSGRRSRG